VDTLLADTNRPRLLARGVIGIDAPVRLAELIPTEGWEPVDTRLQATDVVSLVERIGGRELYGDDDTIPIRELIQNASDAVRARRVVDRLPSDWGHVIVRLGRDSIGDWLEVEDSGIGMSRNVLAGPLLDFGVSYWNSPLMREEWPGLIGRGFEPTGRYGIGFFSVFMLGRHVRVVTRRVEDARKETRVLEFSTGARSRPLLRLATEDEQLMDGGTRIRVWLKTPLDTPKEGLLHVHEPYSFEDLCAWLCPALDVDLFVERPGHEQVRVVKANDWLTMDGAKLLERVRDNPGSYWLKRYLKPLKYDVAPSLRHLYDTSKRVIGRAAIFMDTGTNLSRGVLCVGGLRACTLHGLSGVLLGFPTTAARDSALPFFDEAESKRWAEEQIPLISTIIKDSDAQQHCASLVYLLSGGTGTLPIAESSEGALNAEMLVHWARQHDEIVVFERDGAWVTLLWKGPVALLPNVLSLDQVSAAMIGSRSRHRHPIDERFFAEGTILFEAALNAIATAWGTKPEHILKFSPISEDGEDEAAIEVPIGRRENELVTMSNVYILRRPVV
jgi:hypothetical protein